MRRLNRWWRGENRKREVTESGKAILLCACGEGGCAVSLSMPRCYLIREAALRVRKAVLRDFTSPHGSVGI